MAPWTWLAPATSTVSSGPVVADGSGPVGAVSADEPPQAAASSTTASAAPMAPRGARCGARAGLVGPGTTVTLRLRMEEGRTAPAAERGTVREVAAVFGRLGVTAFGGPAAHIALMRDEVVRRRGWVSDERFLDLLGATNLIPGPNSTEMAIHLGYVRAGWPGLVVGGLLFITPAMVLVLALAWAYVTYGSLPQAQWLLYGIKPGIIGIVAQALYALGRTAVKGPVPALVAAGVLALYVL